DRLREALGGQQVPPLPRCLPLHPSGAADGDVLQSAQGPDAVRAVDHGPRIREADHRPHSLRLARDDLVAAAARGRLPDRGAGSDRRPGRSIPRWLADQARRFRVVAATAASTRSTMISSARDATTTASACPPLSVERSTRVRITSRTPAPAGAGTKSTPAQTASDIPPMHSRTVEKP